MKLGLTFILTEGDTCIYLKNLKYSHLGIDLHIFPLLICVLPLSFQLKKLLVYLPCH